MTGLEMYTRNKQDAVRGMEMEGMGLVALHTIVLLLRLDHDESSGMIDCSWTELHLLESWERMSYATLVFATHGIGSRVGAVGLVHAICAWRIVIEIDVSLTP